MISFSDLFKGMLFGHFEDAVSFCFSEIPYLLIFVFLVSVVFTIFSDIMHIGGK